MTEIADRAAERLRKLGQPWELACFMWLPALVLGFALWFLLRSSGRLGDFPIFRNASRAVLHGDSPYAAATPVALAHFDKFVYPPAAAFLFSPLAVVPFDAGRVLLFVLGSGAALWALQLLDVADWRCYGLAAASAPIVESGAIGALTSFLLLGTALTWHYRNRPALSGSVAAVTGVVKLFLWPLGLWMLATRRFVATAVFAFVTIFALALSWAAIDFAGMRTYPQTLRILSRVEAGVSYSPLALVHISGSVSLALTSVLLALLIAAVFLAARGADGERRSFAVAVIGSLIVTPVIWLHYFALLFVPIALYRPRLSGLWFVPLVLWLTPEAHSGGMAWKIALALVVTGAVAVRTIFLGGRASVRANSASAS